MFTKSSISAYDSLLASIIRSYHNIPSVLNILWTYWAALLPPLCFTDHCLHPTLSSHFWLLLQSYLKSFWLFICSELTLGLALLVWLWSSAKRHDSVCCGPIHSCFLFNTSDMPSNTQRMKEEEFLVVFFTGCCLSECLPRLKPWWFVV